MKIGRRRVFYLAAIAFLIIAGGAALTPRVARISSPVQGRLPGESVFFARAANARVTRVETLWKNYGLMTAEDVSRHRLEIDREGRAIRHTIYASFGETVAAEFKYDLSEKICADFFQWLEKRSGINGWRDDYTIEMMDGYAWEVRLAAGEKLRVIKGNQTPPRGDEIERRILALADFQITPKIF
jgi:hypothetical protein